MRATALYALNPHCPTCFRALATPEWWSQVENRTEEWTQPAQVHCETCKRTVLALFYQGRDNY